MKLLPAQGEAAETSRGPPQLSQQRGLRLGPGLAFHPVGAVVLFPVAYHQAAGTSSKLGSGIWLPSGKVTVVLAGGGRGVTVGAGPGRGSYIIRFPAGTYKRRAAREVARWGARRRAPKV